MKTIRLIKFAPALLGLLWFASSGFAAQSEITKAAPQSAPKTASAALPRLGVQLWSVKEELKKDFKGTIKALAAMGFEGVEFAGEFGEFADDPAALKRFLQQNNLEASSAHVHFKNLSPENFHATVAFYQAIDCDKLIIAMDDRAWDPEGVYEVVKELKLLADKLAAYDMSIGYHNHAQEFGDFFKDVTYWDFIARATPKNVILQMDAGWVNFAGKDPQEYVRRYPGRTVVTHYKIRTPEGAQNITPIIGQDAFDWSALLAADMKVGGTRWVVLEQEEYPDGMTPLQAVKASKAGLDAVLASHKAP